jgi:hypothetical protein
MGGMLRSQREGSGVRANIGIAMEHSLTGSVEYASSSALRERFETTGKYGRFREPLKEGAG